MLSNTVHPFADIIKDWIATIINAKDYKEAEFEAYARKTRNMLKGNNNSTPVWTESGEMPGQLKVAGDMLGGVVADSFVMKMNQVFESVALFGPSILGQTPTINVNPEPAPMASPSFFGIMPFDEMGMMAYQEYAASKQFQQESLNSDAEVFEHYMNWLQRAGNKIAHGREAMTDALVSGMGVLYTGMHTPAGSQNRYALSEFIPERFVVWDQDARRDRDIMWMAILHVQPINRVAEEFGIPYEEFKRYENSSTFSSHANASMEENEYYKQTHQGKKSHNLVAYWEIFSKNGIGQWLDRSNESKVKENLETMEQLGRFVRIVACNGIPYPLNCPSWVLAQEQPEEIINRFQWPTPYWIDEHCDGGWPITRLSFCSQIDCTYPMSIPRSVLPEMEFVNFVMTRLANRISASCDTIMAIEKGLVDDIRTQLKSQTGVYKVLEVASENSGKKLTELIQFINSNINSNADIWKMMSEVIDRINKGMGTTDLVYGSSASAFRSAEEARLKGAAVSVRPDDMKRKMEVFLANVAKKEAICTAWNAQAEDLAPILGEQEAVTFIERVASQDIRQIAQEFNFTIEAGSMAMINQETKLQHLIDIGRYILPIAGELAMSGQPQIFNAWITDYSKLLRHDATQYLIPVPEPQPPQEDLEQQAKYEEHQQNMQMRYEEHLQVLDQKNDKFEADLAYQDFLRRVKLSNEETIRAKKAANQSKVKPSGATAK